MQHQIALILSGLVTCFFIYLSVVTYMRIRKTGKLIKEAENQLAQSAARSAEIDSLVVKLKAQKKVDDRTLFDVIEDGFNIGKGYIISADFETTGGPYYTAQLVGSIIKEAVIGTLNDKDELIVVLEKGVGIKEKVPAPLTYMGKQHGSFSGKAVNVQNLPKGTAEFDHVGPVVTWDVPKPTKHTLDVPEGMEIIQTHYGMPPIIADAPITVRYHDMPGIVCPKCCNRSVHYVKRHRPGILGYFRKKVKYMTCLIGGCGYHAPDSDTVITDRVEYAAKRIEDGKA